MSKTLTVRGTDTGTTMLDGAVRDGELGEVVTDHLRLDLDRVEDLGRCLVANNKVDMSGVHTLPL